MWVNMLATAVNLFLDYGMIFGNFGFPGNGDQGCSHRLGHRRGVFLVIYVVLMGQS